MEKSLSYKFIYELLCKPAALAHLKGSSLAPGISGTVGFYPAHDGTLVAAEVFNLPGQMPGFNSTPPIGPFGFHVHEGGVCDMPNAQDPFMNALGHYNPANAVHPMHAGDMPVLFSNNGYAYMAFYTDRFKPSDVIGKTVIIHLNPDDFRSQPAGDSGKRIACGVIKKA